MKFYQIGPFQDYIKTATLKKGLFLIISGDDFERHSLLEKTVLSLPHENDFSISRYGFSHQIEAVIESMSTLSLFGSRPIVVLDEVEMKKTGDINLFLDFLRRQNGDIYLVVGAKSKKTISSLVSFFDKEGIVLDMTSEKIWDKEKRFISYLMQKCADENKLVEYDAILFLVKKVGLDAAILENEIKKVITYVGDKKYITSKDISDICLSSLQYSLWQLSEKIVWKQELDLSFPHMDASFFHGLIASIRIQLQQGLKMASLIEKNTSPTAYKSYFPRLFPKQLETKKQVSKNLGRKWFQYGLICLYEIDIYSKNNVSSFSLLWDLFCRKIRKKSVRG